MKYRLLALAALLPAGTTAALAQSQGVSKTEITLGSIRICRARSQALANKCAWA